MELGAELTHSASYRPTKPQTKNSNFRAFGGHERGLHGPSSHHVGPHGTVQYFLHEFCNAMNRQNNQETLCKRSGHQCNVFCMSSTMQGARNNALANTVLTIWPVYYLVSAMQNSWESVILSEWMVYIVFPSGIAWSSHFETHRKNVAPSGWMVYKHLLSVLIGSCIANVVVKALHKVAGGNAPCFLSVLPVHCIAEIMQTVLH